MIGTEVAKYDRTVAVIAKAVLGRFSANLADFAGVERSWRLRRRDARLFAIREYSHVAKYFRRTASQPSKTEPFLTGGIRHEFERDRGIHAATYRNPVMTW